MKKRIIWTLAAALVLTPLIPTGVMASSSTVSNSVKTLDQIASEKAVIITEYGVPSVQYALIDNGVIKVSGQTGFNDIEGKIPLTKETIYGIGSTSKVFTAAAVMKLVDEGKINLDTPVVQYITDFKMEDDRYKQITPRMLLNHSSGFLGSSLTSAFLFDDPDTYVHDTLLEQLSTQKLKAAPGAFSVYSNDGFTLAEILVERVSKMTFTAFIQHHFAAPLGMKHTMTPQNKVDSGQFAGLYSPAYEGQLPNETTNAIGTGGIYSTAEDLVRFSQLFTGQRPDVLSIESAKAMEQEEFRRGFWPKDGDNSMDFGLGWDSVRLFPFNDYGIKALVKGGDTQMYHASLVVLPEQNMAAAVISSGGSAAINQLLASELLLQAMKEKGTIKEIKPEKSFGKPVKADMPKDIEKYGGNYSTQGDQWNAAIKDGELVLTGLTAPAQTFIYTTDGTFVDEDGSTKVSFVKESNGRTYFWMSQYISVPELGQLAYSEYKAEKLEGAALNKETADAWAKREGKFYFPVNEKFTSTAYMSLNPPMIQTNGGHFNDMKITGPNTAESKHQIPGVAGRDALNILFYEKDGKEYLTATSSVYMSEDAVKPLYNGQSSKATVQADGYARWFSIPEAAAGKKMVVVMPEKGAFMVYDEMGALVNNTVISGKNEVVLPANGYIVFAGNAGSSFGITLVK
ncbi:serine hydrolase domain-containing protein [Paenibacillus paeoniae]|uniref:Class A beta-lactamase-related serine hydrolase n=1 Tax=Paenibacillus paeoniae TaxID=2292705 RepID=A0A371PGY0_9BACL|nr:serine hydrolase domain-containing protein [Paenibacillus paeoniae]REK74798.1 class A beta-lactamase-related serine hydrolase [Paenibacillus paeoniae]